MTLEQWQRSPELLAWTAKLFAEPNWQLLSQMLDTEHPKNYQQRYSGISADRELGIIYGYDQFRNNLEQAGVAPLTSQAIEPTYETEDLGQQLAKDLITAKSKK